MNGKEKIFDKYSVRRFAVAKQCLLRRPIRIDKKVIERTIMEIGLLQLDTISVVDRSHYLVLLSRLGNYDRSDVNELVYPRSLLFEHWAHAASLIPMQDYSYMAPLIKKRVLEPLSPRRLRALGSEPKQVFNSVVREITHNGPLMSRDFEDTRKEKGSWWNRKPARVALDWLHYTGRLMVERRENFQCVYNLSQRVLPKSARNERHTLPEWERWSTLRSLRCLGVGTHQHIADYYRQPLTVVKRSLAKLLQSGEVTSVQVEGMNGQAFVLSSDIATLYDIGNSRYDSEITCFLSPFDNLIWHRTRVQELFDFRYRNEMYTPLAKRQRVYGYYVMPIFHRGELVGRLDPKVDRASNTLIIHNIAIEQEKHLSAQFITELVGALAEFMLFTKCNSLRLKRSSPTILGKLLKKSLS